MENYDDFKKKLLICSDGLSSFTSKGIISEYPMLPCSVDPVSAQFYLDFLGVWKQRLPVALVSGSLPKLWGF